MTKAVHERVAGVDYEPMAPTFEEHVKKLAELGIGVRVPSSLMRDARDGTIRSFTGRKTVVDIGAVYPDPEDDSIAVEGELTSGVVETSWVFPERIRDWKYDLEAQTGWVWDDEELSVRLRQTLDMLNLRKEKDVEASFVIDPSRYFTGNTFQLGPVVDDVERFVTVRVFEDKSLWWYDTALGVFKPGGKERVQAIVAHLLTKATYTPERSNRVLKFLEQREGATLMRAFPDSRYINVLNGMLVWREGRVIPHDPMYGSTIQVPVHYRPSADGAKLDAFLRSVFVGADDNPEEVMRSVYEVIAYQLVPAMDFKMAVLLKGEGDTGKSSFLDLLAHIVGPEHVAHYTLKRLNEPYADATLFAKLLNIGGDLRSFAGQDVERFMSLVGRDTVQARQIYGVPFKYDPFVKLLFATNAYPWSPNQHDAYYSRFLVIPTPNKFVKGDPDWKQRDELLAELTTPAELASLLNDLLAALGRLQERRGFDPPASWVVKTAEYRIETSTLAGFLADCIGLADPDTFVTRKSVWAAYRAWCASEAQEDSIVRPNELYDAILAFGAKKKIVHGERGFRGIRLIPEAMAGLPDATPPPPATGLFAGAKE